MNKFKIVLAYDGTQYGGWQVQPNSISIQGLVENALSTILRVRTPLTGSGRTDAGVHALAQTAHFTSSKPFDLFKLQLSLNGILPTDIRILSIQSMPTHFHARYSATSKIYRYHLRLEKNVNPFKRLYSLHLHFPLSIELLKEAASYFIGEHDFTSFSNHCDRGAAASNPVRTIHRLDIVREEGGIYLEFEGNGFLYKMVRNITGTLLDVCRGKIHLNQLPAIFAAKERSKASAAAPPHGLFLVKVNYDNLAGISTSEEKREMPLSALSLS
ncbi:MAG TPA: tRNA pseudouridine(38-40) synthase TruA [Rhabdochlamydiaceae bacterium]|nr:tRNA pseudouridine(38-40) synthase TruA [Rhabdochlamydiaceae bacterium]